MNMKKYVENMKKYVENMKKCEETWRRYEENMQENEGIREYIILLHTWTVGLTKIPLGSEGTSGEIDETCRK